MPSLDKLADLRLRRDAKSVFKAESGVNVWTVCSRATVTLLIWMSVVTYRGKLDLPFDYCYS
jgi:hypothetical protein